MPHLIPANLWRLARLTVAACAFMACGDRAGDATRGDHTAIVRRATAVTLEEPDSLQLGSYATFIARSGSGRTFVADQQQQRVVGYAPDGRPAQVYGRPGSGPGEFEFPSVVALLSGDSLLAVVDVNRRYLSLFDRESGGYIRGRELPSQDVDGNWSVSGDSALFALQFSDHLLAVWNWRSDSLRMIGHTPTALLAALDVSIRHGRAGVIPTPDAYLVALPTEPWLRVLDLSGRPVGRVALPTLRRRGEPPDLVARSRQRTKQARVQPLGSLLAGIHRLSTGEVVVAHIDVDYVGQAPRGRLGNMRMYVTILSPDLGHACVDTPVPLTSDTPLYPAFRGDTMFALTRIVSDDNRVASEVWGFTFNTGACVWQPTGGVDREGGAPAG